MGAFAPFLKYSLKNYAEYQVCQQMQPFEESLRLSFLPAGCIQCARLVLQLLCDFCVCLFVCLPVRAMSGEACERANSGIWHV